ncbi:DNA repair protein RecN (Recombination protein N) [Lachnospiraceae bacterium RM5]|nr:DNA repair protein RecN (Recombination protein N) [Lachnospiraceae bacterium RM5]
MLVNLNVKNFALIEEEDVYFGNGINILTGETGAGKSIIIGSVLIALGEKVSKEMIRDNEKPSLAEVVFEINNDDLKNKFNDFGIDMDGNEIIISRKIVNGRSVTKINGETFTQGKVKEISEYLLDIYGQHDYHSLNKKEKHLELLDDYIKNENLKVKEDVVRLYKEYTDLKKEYENLDIDDENREREMSLCKFEIDEIENAHLKPGEYDEVEKEHKKISSSKLILDKMAEVYTYLSNGYDGISEKLSSAIKELVSVSDLDADIKSINDSFADMENICSDIVRDTKSYIDSMNFDESELNEIENRMGELSLLRQKYEKTKESDDVIENILKYKESREKVYNDLLNLYQIKEDLLKRIQLKEKEIEEKSLELSEIRKKYAKELSDNIENVLKDLNFNEVVFEVVFKRKDNYSLNGIDDVEFYISTNPGESTKPLSSVASGGELSRIMLGIKTIMASKDNIETLIFDEIDTGISGKTAQMVAERIKKISGDSQIICITHLPQIAAVADNHYLIEKSAVDGKTYTSIRKLNEEESVNELARMLGGAKITESVLGNARELKEFAKNIK